MWRKGCASLLLGTAFVAAATRVMAQQVQPQAPQSYGPWSEGYFWSFWWICPAMMLVMFGIVAVILLTRRHATGIHLPWQGSTSPALQILNERFARGEIQRDEFEERKAAILSGH